MTPGRSRQPAYTGKAVLQFCHLNLVWIGFWLNWLDIVAFAAVDGGWTTHW